MIATDRCNNCHACATENIGCPCDGSFDDGCFLCTPDRHKRPPCPEKLKTPEVVEPDEGDW